MPAIKRLNRDELNTYGNNTFVLATRGLLSSLQKNIPLSTFTIDRKFGMDRFIPNTFVVNGGLSYEVLIQEFGNP